MSAIRSKKSKDTRKSTPYRMPKQEPTPPFNVECGRCNAAFTVTDNRPIPHAASLNSEYTCGICAQTICKDCRYPVEDNQFFPGYHWTPELKKNLTNQVCSDCIPVCRSIIREQIAKLSGTTTNPVKPCPPDCKGCQSVNHFYAIKGN